ncbi:twin-arginine translocation signal domain-containing protein [Compostibacter hankyongensis]|uniref:Non-reducing end beta-L-arabinofuranosidase-like GH127 middle domain-containing protein n=1 Tax=Compostibacter hankyongensis TaxID=1007089 RepID=A0ABP8G191_9BACT
MEPKTRRDFLKQASALGLTGAFVPAGIRDFLTRSATTAPAGRLLQPAAFADIMMKGELLTRAFRNYDRLETDIYRPENDFNAGGASEGWPGDKEGRIILGLTLQAQATRREPKYLDEIIRLIPSHVNEKGYLGPVMKDKILEQQLSGHGWLLRGLCEHYAWKKDPQVKQHIRNIIYNLALPTRGHHKDYPIDPGSRRKNTGEAAGTTQNTIGRWMLSSDIGCDFIFLDGVVQAYGLFPSAELKALIEEMTDRFLQMDLIAIKAQTHATLTGLRGVLRYYETTRRADLLSQVEKRYALYRAGAMTENYENFNWFGRPEWTEPCAIVDSLMVAVQLWQHTGKTAYLEDAHHIYYNALGHTQRANGGFGLDNCPGPDADVLRVNTDEAYWCCTMRGGEGLASAIRYACFTTPEAVMLPFYHNSEADLVLGGRPVRLRQETGYPFAGKMTLTVTGGSAPDNIRLGLFAPSWAGRHSLKVNGRPQDFKTENGFLMINSVLKEGNVITLEFDQALRTRNRVNAQHTRPGRYGISYGPLLLGYEGAGPVSLGSRPRFVRSSPREWEVEGEGTRLSTVYHLMDAKVNKASGYQKQILFKG